MAFAVMIDHEALQKLRAFAEKKENWRDCTPNDHVMRTPGDSKSHTVKMLGSTTVTVVFSIDVDKRIGVVKHMSISMGNRKLPHPALIQEVGRELGIEEPYLYAGSTPGDPEWVFHLMAEHKEGDEARSTA